MRCSSPAKHAARWPQHRTANGACRGGLAAIILVLALNGTASCDSTPDHVWCALTRECGSPDDGRLRGTVRLPSCPSECPPLAGYTVSCNAQDFCEYQPSGTALPGWRRHDRWIWVPPGSFPMGPATSAVEDGLRLNTYLVTFRRGFFIGKYEVTRAGFVACRDSTTESHACHETTGGWGACVLDEQGRDDHPMNCVTRDTAAAYCAWLGSGRGRLPSEAEWEYAAKGPVNRVFPWGDDWATCDRAVMYADGAKGCGQAHPAAVGSRPRGMAWCGAMDMAGNVWEWVADCYPGDSRPAPSDGTANSNCVNEMTGTIRGGGYANTAAGLRAAYRVGSSTEVSTEHLGFRCVLSP